MQKVIRLTQAKSLISKFKNQSKTIVLVGGVFDILHYGHVRFLEMAKKQGDILIVALEPDKKIQKLKGNGRPINAEKMRAHVLSALSTVDYIILLPVLSTNKDYENLVKQLKPDVIAVTKGDQFTRGKREQAKSVGGKLVVCPKIPTPSTSQLTKLLAIE